MRAAPLSLAAPEGGLNTEVSGIGREVHVRGQWRQPTGEKGQASQHSCATAPPQPGFP